MTLEQADKELAAIGASIGAGCRFCIEHHLPAGREAGLTPRDLGDAVDEAENVCRMAADLLSQRVGTLLEATIQQSTRPSVRMRPQDHASCLLSEQASVPTPTRCSSFISVLRWQAVSPRESYAQP
jgi:AhpD family alkylhydroperoxidase